MRRTIVLLMLAVASAVAAEPPTGRTYFTVAVGLEGRHAVGAWCLEFIADRVSSLDGEISGTWRGVVRDARRPHDLAGAPDRGGSAEHLANELRSRRVAVDLSGNSHVVVRVRASIDGTATGSSRVEYIGHPGRGSSPRGFATRMSR